MKIGIDIRCLMEEQYSGISEYTHNLIRHLVRSQPSHEYVLFYNSAKKASLPDLTGPNVRFAPYTFPNKLFNLSMRFAKFPKVDRLIGGVDVFIIPNYLFLHLSPAVKRLLIVHDLSFELYPEFFTLKKQLWHHLINPRRMSQRADAVVAISENTKRDILRLYQVSSERISVIHNGINDLFFDPITDDDVQRVRAKYRLPARPVLYLGNLEPRKNLSALVGAFSHVSPDATLVIAGGEAWKFRPVYRSAQALLAQDRVKFLGYVDQADMPALYRAASVFVYPSIYEGFGLPPLEAMACGTPVVCSHSSSLPEAVGDAALMVDPNNMAAIASGINQILGDSALSARLRVAGRAQAEKFRWSRAAAEFSTVLNQLGHK